MRQLRGLNEPDAETVKSVCVGICLGGKLVGITRYCLSELCIRVFFLQSSREKKGEYISTLHLQDSQMSQSCEIRLGDSSEVVCIQIPGQRNG